MIKNVIIKLQNHKKKELNNMMGDNENEIPVCQKMMVESIQQIANKAEKKISKETNGTKSRRHGNGQ